ncbi:MAG TPA: trehalose-phosphatase [Planctomycetota bacterium]|nr:trehalose-phosphatase [Planctomycetota bacterium]
MNDFEHWHSLACHTPLGILTDLDGTLIPFAPTPDEAKVDVERIELLKDLVALPGVTVAVVSGRPRDSLDRMLSAVQGISLIAEHGGWTRARGAWQAMAELEPNAFQTIAQSLEKIAARYQGAIVERKTWSVTLHHRRVRPSEKAELLIETAALVDSWLSSNPGFERLDGAELLEVRPVRLRKSSAVPWMRELLGPGGRILALGDDLTDEDLFHALGVGDEAILVGRQHGRGTFARWRLLGSSFALSFLRWIVAARRESPTPGAPVLPTPITLVPRGREKKDSEYQLLAVSNRLPNLRSEPALPDQDRKKGVGGLVSALEPALASRRGIWLGWNGRLVSGNEPGFVVLDDGTKPALAWIDLPKLWHAKYYNGLCNRSLWPLFHSFPGQVRFALDEWECYEKVNDAFAAAVVDLVGPETPVWAHDYHLLLLASAMRQRGHRGPIGLFLHIPFPGADLFSLFPWADKLLDSMLDFDLLGFQTPVHVDNFRQCVGLLSPAKLADDVVLHHGRRIRVRDFPIGIIPEDFQEPQNSEMVEEITAVLSPFSRSRKILGVDRLDYTKGIPERLLAFARMLELFPEWRSKVSFLQISVPSREDVPEYAEQRARVENIVGRINGEFGEANWVPIRYLYRSYAREQLSALYRSADVGCVTPLRDGMNLVAKEYVASQKRENPGVLVLSSFAGAARELRDAVLTNPWYMDGLARDLDRALRMPLEERKVRHEKLLAAVSKTTALTWAQDFISTLEACRS